MTSRFNLPSSDPALLAKATQVADAFAQTYMGEGITGIAYLGAVARGYFDAYADIDVILFQDPGADIRPPQSYIHEQGFEIHTDLLRYDQEVAADWGMAKRWAYSTHRIAYDPRGLLAALFAGKIPLRPAERRWLMIEGITQSDWYINTLPRLWIERGSLVSAQHMFDEGLTHFFNALFGLNNELVADVKWRSYAVQQLPLLPPRFAEQLEEVLRVNAFTPADIERRQQAFKPLWQFALPLVEAEVQMPYAEFSLLV